MAVSGLLLVDHELELEPMIASFFAADYVEEGFLLVHYVSLIPAPSALPAPPSCPSIKLASETAFR